MKGLLFGVDVPGEWCPEPVPPADPDGLTSLEVGNESPVGPNAGVFLGPTTLGSSTAELGRFDDSLGERGATRDWGLFCASCTESIDVGGGSCWGGEICGVTMAGSPLRSAAAAGFPS